MDGGEGNRVGWMEGGEGGSCFVGEESGKNTAGWTGETGEGEEGVREAGLVGEGRFGAASLGDDGDEQETGVEGERGRTAGGSEADGASEEKQGAGRSDGTRVPTFGGEEAQGDGDSCKELSGAEGS